MISTRHSMTHQRGATLLVSLIMLVVLTLFAVTGFNLSSVNLRIAGNFQMQKTMEAAAQQAIEQVISASASFGGLKQDISVPPYTVTVTGPAGGTTGPKCNYAVTAKGYTKKIGELTPEDTDWELKAEVSDTSSGARATLVQGVRVRLLSGNCPTT
ncbi:MAG: pilus assembly PilX family protein [Betaproteobacteria bacterium]